MCGSKCFGHSDSGDPGEEGEWGDKGHFLAEQGEEGVLQRSPPKVMSLLVLGGEQVDGQVCGEDPQGDGEAGDCRQGVGLSQGQ